MIGNLVGNISTGGRALFLGGNNLLYKEANSMNFPMRKKWPVWKHASLYFEVF